MAKGNQRSLVDRIFTDVGRAQTFFAERVWAASLDRLDRRTAILYRISRIVYATFRGFREKRLSFRAAALTYFSILSVVPFLAFAFSALKGFGLYDRLVHNTLLPYVREIFGGNPALLRAIEQVLAFVEGTNVGSLGTFGVLFLVYSGIGLLSTIETALNDVWGAKNPRPFLRRVTDYTTLLVITPLLVMTAITFATATQSSGMVQFLRDTLALGPVIDFLLKLTSWVLGCIALIALFIIMPNTKTKMSSVMLGGLIGGSLWQGVLILHVNFQSGVARYNALYSGFAAIPIFLVWLYISWLVVLLSAQLAASHQQELLIRRTLRPDAVDQQTKEDLAVALFARAVRAFDQGAPPPTEEAFSAELEIPQSTIDDVLNTLVRARLLARAVRGGTVGYLPARDPGQMRLHDLLHALRTDPCAEEIRDCLAKKLNDPLREALRAVQGAPEDSPHNLTLRELARLGPPLPAGDGVDENADVDEALVDAKQPEVPA